MAKRKKKKFAELNTFPNVLQIPYTDLWNKDYELKGKWSEKIFGNNNPLVLELGCGKAEYSLGLARLYPGRNYIGIDIKGERLWRGAKTALEDGLENVFFVRAKIDFIDRLFAEGEVSEIWLTFPDPQPTKRRMKKRLTSPKFLDMYKRILVADNFVNLKTDNQLLYEYTLEVLAERGEEVFVSTADVYSDFPDDKVLNIKTFYEQMFLAEGKTIKYIRFRVSK
jgi:tRNA (guanine-N7-)-methyltransferase